LLVRGRDARRAARMDSKGPVGAGAMTRRSLPIAHRLIRATLRAAFLLVVLVMAASQSGTAQAEPYERTYFQSKGAVERALKELQPSMGGRLPVLEGFALPSDHPL